MEVEKSSIWEELFSTKENTILKIALQQLQVKFFVYDIAQKRLYFPSVKEQSGKEERIKEEYTKEEFLQDKVPEKDQRAEVEELFQKMEQGEKSAVTRIKFSNKEHVFWCDVVMTCLYDEAGMPAEAVGTIQDTTSLGETKLKYNREKEYREAMLADCRRVYEINVTKNRFTQLKSIQDSTDTGEWEDYMKAMNWLRETRVYHEDWAAFLDIADREHLLQGYQIGKTEFYCEYRVVDKQGNMAWSSSATHLLKDPDTGDIKGFIYIKDIDKQKKWELELARQAECDSLTGIYNRRMAERLIQEKLDTAGDKQRYGFLMIDIDDFKYVNDHFGHVKGDLLLQKMAKQINMTVGEADIFARLGGDEFIVFLEENESRGRVKRIADLICDTVRNIRIAREQEFQPSVSIGIALYPESGTTFKQLYAASDQALYHVKRHGKNYADFYQM